LETPEGKIVSIEPMTGRYLLTGGSDLPWVGGAVSEHATCVLAGNPSPLTLDGTNTWVLGSATEPTCLVVDPGPDDAGHRAAVLSAVGDRRVEAVLLTHGHPDHAQGAGAFARAAGARPVPVRALDPAHRLGEEGLSESDVIAAGGVEVRVLATPGHTADSLCFLVDAPDAHPDLLTGDTVLGRGTSVVAFPDGRLGPYLESLDRLALVCAASGTARLLPGHGPVLDDPQGVLAAYVEHRRERLAQVAAAMRAGARTASEVVEAVYADVDKALWPAATASVKAQLEYLAAL
jgi:glyoxylase-like metal-dependent hydrolase (beta-lactamase superfamily II)